MDNFFDNMIRAKVLVDTIIERCQKKTWQFAKNNKENNKTYYIIQEMKS